jgi:autotransporter strand-loop-strand O-heptosyltransferase
MKIVYLAPHLSTGGCPQFILKRIQSLLAHTEGIEVYVVEYSYHGDAYVVQRNAIKQLLGKNFGAHFSTKVEIADYIGLINPDIIHIDEMSERLDQHLMKALYRNDRKWYIIETCHDISFDPSTKVFHPDLFMFCSPYHEDTFADLESLYETIEYPVDFKVIGGKEKIKAKMQLGMDLNKKHILNVGLWTKGKNQGEMLEIAKQYPEMIFHSVGNQAGNFADYWQPLMKDVPPNVKIWGERADVELFMTAADVFMFNSTWECNPLVLREAMAHTLPIVARNLPQYGDMFTKYLDPIDTDLRNITRKYKTSNDKNSRAFALKHEKAYKELMKVPIRKQQVSITQHFVNQPFLEIKGNSESDFLVQFLDEKGSIYYQNTIKANHWVRLNRQWYTKWRTKVFEGKDLIYNSTLDLEGKKVFIAIDSKSLGDSLAWIPYVEEFRNKHNCTVVCSTFWNKILDYPEIEFVEPGTMIGCYAMYTLGWHWNEDKEPTLCNTIPLQQSASNILGLDYVELKPRLKYDIGENKYGKYVTIATNSTAGLKFWTKSAWAKVINHLHEIGYKVINTSKERNPFENCYQLEDTSIENTMSVIHHSEYMVGLSSGLSWLAFGLGKKVVMISAFTEADHEFDCIRPRNNNVCTNCWNDPKIKFDAGDFNFCPHHKGTERMFECHTSITPEMVIQQLPL